MLFTPPILCNQALTTTVRMLSVSLVHCPCDPVAQQEPKNFDAETTPVTVELHCRVWGSTSAAP